MDLLTTRRAALALALAAHGCGVKPLQFVESDAPDAVTVDTVVADALAVDAVAVDAVTVDAVAADAVAVDAVTLDTSADVADAAVDVARGDGGPVVPTSCAATPDRDDCRTVRIEPAGPFCVGVDAAAESVGWNASPPLCGLSLSPFYVDRTEVSVARFRAFFARWSAGALTPILTARFGNGLNYRAPLPPPSAASEWSPTMAGCNWSDAPDGAREQHPINCVGWSLAMYFCAWEGGHLVTSTQYEYLARWHSAAAAGRTFPWGEEAPSCGLAHHAPCAGDDGLRTRRVGGTARGPQGVFDLAGNVADFVADDFATYTTLASSPCWTSTRRDPLCMPSLAGVHFARGSNFMNTSELLLRSVFRPSTANDAASPVRGVRCAYPAPP